MNGVDYRMSENFYIYEKQYEPGGDREMPERTSDMSNRLQRMITNYKTLGDRVDEVLWKEVSDANKRLNSLDVENFQLRKALQSACNSLGAEIEDYLSE